MPPKFGHEITTETRAKISKSLKGRKRPDVSAALAGKKQPPELVTKRAAAQTRWGQTCSIPGCGKRHSARGWCSAHYRRWQLFGDPLGQGMRPSGAANPNWKGNAIGYDAAHLRAKTWLPRECQSCGATHGRLEIALRKDAAAENLRPSDRVGAKFFSVDPGDYARLCVTCHRRYDSPRADTRAPIIAALSANRQPLED